MAGKTLKFAVTLGLLGALLAGCSGSNDGASDEIEKLKQEIATLKAENEKLKSEQSNEPSKAEDVSGNVEEDDVADEPTADPNSELTVQLNKAAAVADFAEFTVTGTQFSKVIKPSKPGDLYTYYEAKEADTTYLAITIKFKSLLANGKSADEFADVTVKYNDKYEYSTFSTIEEQGGSDFTYTNITSIEPLKTETLLFLAEVPTEVESGTSPLKAVISVNGSDYELTIR